MAIFIHHLSITLHDGTSLVDDFSYILQGNEKVALIGEEGVGKSTLLRVLLQDPHVAEYADVTGIIDSQHQIIGYIPQQLTTEQLIKQPSDYVDLEHHPNLFATAARLGLSSTILQSTRTLSQLSGGERVKLMVLHALMKTPDILLMDEPTNDLDLQGLEWLENTLATLTIPVLMISHDETLIQRIARRLIHMERIRHKQVPRITVFEGTLRDYRATRLATFAHQDQVALAERRQRDKQAAILRQLHDKLDHQLRLAVRQPSWGRLLKKKMRIVTAQEKKIEEKDYTPFHEETESFYVLVEPFTPRHAHHVVLDWHNEALRLPNGTSLHITLHLRGQDNVVIEGNNGVGKSTLLRAIVDYLVHHGYHVGYMPQDYQEVWDSRLSAIEFLTQQLGTDKAMQTAIQTTLSILHIPREEALRPYVKLSGGTRAKVIWVGILLRHPDILILDEPTRNISPLALPALREVIDDYPGAILMVTHDRQWIAMTHQSRYTLGENGLSPHETELSS